MAQHTPSRSPQAPAQADRQVRPARPAARRQSLYRLAAHVLAAALAAWLLFDALTGNLTVNPIQAATQRTGRYAIYFLALSLAMSPLNSLLHQPQALKARRPLGLYAFLFAAVHFTLVVGVDYGFNLGLIWLDLATKSYIIIGALTLLILIPLAVTSFDYWKVALGKNWKRLHRLVYLAAPLAALHFAWARKGDLSSLQGDIVLPLLIGAGVLLLLVLRLPPIRRRLVQR